MTSGIFFASYIVLWLLFIALIIVIISVLRNVAVLFEALERHPMMGRDAIKFNVGDPLPIIDVKPMSATTTAFASYTNSKVACIVIKPHCPPCRDLLTLLAQDLTPDAIPEFSEAERVIISKGSPSETKKFLQQIKLPSTIPVFIDTKGVLAKEWGISATPTTVIADNREVVRLVVGFDNVDESPNPAETLYSKG